MPKTKILIGEYVGELIWKPQKDGRTMKLVQPFAFVDAAKLKWNVPKDATVDGASIPRLLWTIIGGPFEGKYREASVIHDWFCDKRNRPWKAVHRMFYEAMLTSGVNAAQAKVMYAGVYGGGPRWSETVVSNNNLESKVIVAGDSETPVGAGLKSKAKPKKTTVVYEMPLNEAVFSRVADQVKTSDLALDDIEALVDSETAGLKPRTISKTVTP